MPQGGRFIICDQCNKSTFSLNLPWNRDDETIAAAKAAGWRCIREPDVNFHEDACPECVSKNERPIGESISDTNRTTPEAFTEAMLKITDVVLVDPRTRWR